MLPKSEKKALLGYVHNLLRSNRLNAYIRGEICEWAIENGSLFPGSGKDWVIPDEKKKKGIPQFNVIKRDVAALNENCGEVRESSIDTTMNSLIHLFGLNTIEAELLKLLIRKEKYGFFEELFDRISVNHKRRSSYGKLDTTEIWSVMIGKRILDIAAVVQPKARLMSYGLMEIDCCDDIELTKTIKLVFRSGVVFPNPDKLRDTLAGEVQRPSLTWDDFTHLGHDREILESLLTNAVKRGEKGINILLYGSPGTGKTEFCKTLADRLRISLYAVAEADDHGDEPDRKERLQSLKMLQALLCQAGQNAIVLDEAEDIFGYAAGAGLFAAMFSSSSTVNSKVYMNRLLENNALPVFWLTNSAKGIDKAFVRRMSYCLEFSELPYSVRLRMSKDVCRKNGLNVADKELEAFNKEYDVVPAVFANAARVTSIVGGSSRELRQVIDRQEKLMGGKKNVQQQSNEFSTVFLNTDVDLVQVTQSILEKGKTNFSFCLYGPPGTGKSEYARWLASRMGMEVILKRASDLLSKWVGGTEENIARAFSEALAQNRLLIFDEADSFLHSRREARTSWEVSHVNEMLTWMERHPLPFVCTTNLCERLDEAAFRRFTFKVRFDFLRSPQIAEAFRQFFGMEAPSAALALQCLTPGDFAVVRKKTEYFGPVSAEDIGKMLKQEMALKPALQTGNRLGFQAG